MNPPARFITSRIFFLPAAYCAALSAGIPVEAVTVTLDESAAQYAAGKKKIRDVMKRAGGFMGEIPSA